MMMVKQLISDGKSGLGRKILQLLIMFGIIPMAVITTAFFLFYMEGQRNSPTFFLTISVIIIIFSIIFGYRFSYSNIVKPIRGLREEVEAISKGGFVGRILIKRDDEVGQLADRFNRMLDNLEKTTGSRDTLAEEIQEKEKTAQALQRSVEENRAIITAIPDLILQIDDGGNICSYKASNHSSIFLPEFTTGKLVSDLFPGFVSEAIINHGQETLQTGSNCIFDFPYMVHGKEKYVETRMAVSGENEVIAIFRDITDRKSSEELLRENEERIKQLINIVPDMIYARDMGGKFIFVNQAFANFVGTDIQNLIGKKASDFYPKGIAELAEKNDLTVMESGDARIFPEISVPAINGETRILRITKRLLSVTKNGNALDVVLSVANDITDIKKAEETLKKAHHNLERKVRERTADLERINTQLKTEMEKRERAQNTLRVKEESFETQYQSMPIPTYTWQKSGDDFILVGYNKAAEQITRNGVREWKSRSIAEIYDAEPVIQEDILKCYQKKKTVLRQIEYQFKNNDDIRQLNVIFAFVPPDLVMMHTEDTTQTKILQDQLIRSERLAATGQLAASIAHEINSPLQGITALLSVIRKAGINGEDLVHNVDLVKNAVGSIRDTVRNLLDLNRPGNEKKHPSDINEVISNTIALVSGHIRRSGVSVHLNLDQSIPSLYISPQQLSQVFMNLINNSIEAITGISRKTAIFSEKKNKKGKIDIATIRMKHNITIKVGDNGPGISREDLEHVFDPFYTRKKKMGMGVGLSICHGIVSDHSGRITVINKKEGGAMFSIVLPITTKPTRTGIEDA